MEQHNIKYDQSLETAKRLFSNLTPDERKLILELLRSLASKKE